MQMLDKLGDTLENNGYTAEQVKNTLMGKDGYVSSLGVFGYGKYRFVAMRGVINHDEFQTIVDCDDTPNHEWAFVVIEVFGILEEIKNRNPQIETLNQALSIACVTGELIAEPTI